MKTDKRKTADLKEKAIVIIHCLCEHTAAPAGRKVLPILRLEWVTDSSGHWTGDGHATL